MSAHSEYYLAKCKNIQGETERPTKPKTMKNLTHAHSCTTFHFSLSVIESELFNGKDII